MTLPSSNHETPAWAAKAVFIALAIFCLLLLTGNIQAQTYTVLYSFQQNGIDGYSPSSRLVRDTSGNLYGTTIWGGLYGYGTIFRLDPSGTETILYNFADDPSVGNPGVGTLLLDSDGNLYGITSAAVFEFNIDSGSFIILHAFSGGSDGSDPDGGLFRDTAGNLYGTTWYGGTYDWGTVFKIDAAGNFVTLASLPKNEGCPTGPGWATNGNVYILLMLGGTSGEGALAQITATGQVNTIYSFTQTNGGYPWLLPTGLLQDKSGNVYGTAIQAGGRIHTDGTVWQFSKNTRTLKVLHTFSSSGSQGAEPYGTLVLDKAANLYGVTASGGGFCSSNGGSQLCGLVYKIDAGGAFSIIHYFVNSDGITDGYDPGPGLITDPQGNLYGVGRLGGTFGGGVVFKITR